MRFLLLIALLFITPTVFGQLTRVRGKVTDASTNEPIPFVNIAFKNTTIGVISDFNGNYAIETRAKVDTLIFSYIGYEQKIVKVKVGQYQEINVNLKPTVITLQEVVIKPGKNPALILLDSLNKYRRQNDPDRLNYWESEIYNKIEFDLSNINDEFKKNRLFRQFQFVFDYVDTSVVSGKTFLPIFISETKSNFYYQKSPKKEKEIITASNVSGVKDDQVSQFLGQMYLKINPYENFIELFGKGFVSPIATFGPLYYRYYLIDSAFIDNKWCFQISFKPRRKQEPTFTGDFWVHDTTYALVKINARIAQDVNLNFVNDINYKLDFQHVGDSVWFYKSEETFIDFNISDRTTGIFGNKYTIYTNVIPETPREASFFNPQLSQELIVLEDANRFSDQEWNIIRPIDLTPKELHIFQMVDSIKQVPVFKTWVDVINTLVNGYYVTKWWEIGPYYKLYSFNPIEGNRFRFGGRTSNEFSRRLMLTSHVAFGDEDKKFKFAQGGLYLTNKNPRRGYGWDVKHDMEQLGISQNAFTQDNILASFLRRTYNRKLTMVDELEFFYEHEWFQGYLNTIKFNTRQIWSTEYVPFVVREQNSWYNLNRLPTTEITLKTRFAYNEKYLLGEFVRISLGTDYPILTLNISSSIKGVNGSRHEYYRITGSVDHSFLVNPFGRFRYIIDGGIYFGKAPYPLLQIHEGNETYAYDEYAFNMMNYYEFASDRWVSLLAEHHFEGFFLNRIPMFRKLKWREVIAAKGVIGRVSEKNLKLMDFPDGMRELTKPYLEASIGVENIVKLFRVDAMWRLTYLDKPTGENITDIPKFGIRAAMKFDF
ncbi:MAG TPA: DUF5686 family protein [Salinivirgaceae bacterium]|nr:DUF5686 family protein [Salinivirgaceae bacterium]